MEQPLLLLHHGAGFSALTFATMAAHLHSLQPSLAIVAFDARAHGRHPSEGDDEASLSLDMFCDDLAALIGALRMRWSAPHPVILAGHSLGGAVMTFALHRGLLADVEILGLIVIDIVEESALAALCSMEQILLSRPQTFSSEAQAIAWSVLSRNSRDPRSARISTPSQLRILDGGNGFGWRVDLMKCEQHWQGWFRGLSEAFVGCPVAKLLVLAEREYLDRTLMIASMQGKFQCSIVRDSGHAVQEDQPVLLAQIISAFSDRLRLVARLNESHQSCFIR